jgi:hypothetical protein
MVHNSFDGLRKQSYGKKRTGWPVVREVLVMGEEEASGNQLEEVFDTSGLSLAELQALECGALRPETVNSALLAENDDSLGYMT